MAIVRIHGREREREKEREIERGGMKCTETYVVACKLIKRRIFIIF